MTRRLILTAALFATTLHAQDKAVLLEGEQFKIFQHTGQARPQDLRTLHERDVEQRGASVVDGRYLKIIFQRTHANVPDVSAADIGLLGK